MSINHELRTMFFILENDDARLFTSVEDKTWREILFNNKIKFIVTNTNPMKMHFTSYLAENINSYSDRFIIQYDWIEKYKWWIQDR